MNLLLDTHVLLWWLDDPEQILPETRERIADGTNMVYISAVTAWEIAIKKSIGKLTAPDNLEDVIMQAGFTPLPVSIRHAMVVEQLPMHHTDPFDRMLVAQAQLESLTLLTRDRRMSLYNIASLPA
ncbi:MAG TPA: type II toxin-antitoxin system VapC family toxin [bacterium]|nr:type II toxin-antitoxin system VapC family toxin [bacterium]